MNEEQMQYEAEISNLLRDLADTDWFITRFVENQTPVPFNILEQRAAARRRISLLRKAIRPEYAGYTLNEIAIIEGLDVT